MILFRRLKFKIAFLASLLVLGSSAYAFEININKLLDIGKSTKKAFSSFGEEEQYYIGRSVGASLLSQNNLSDNLELQNYISRIGQTLVTASSRPETFKGYHFIALDEPELLNAYAVPSGFIFITTGLISKTKNEDELAGVLAHEVAHIVFYHPTDSIKKTYRDKLKKDIFSVAADQVGDASDTKLDSLVEGLNELSGMMIDSAAKGYSRKKESKADKEGIHIMINAGYNPEAFVEVLKRLNPIGSGKSGTHGNPTKRAKGAIKVIKKLKEIPAISEQRIARFKIYIVE